MKTKRQQLINSQLPVRDRDRGPWVVPTIYNEGQHQGHPTLTLTVASALFIDPYLQSHCNAVYEQTCFEKMMQYSWSGVIQVIRCLRSQRWVMRRFKWRVISYKSYKLRYAANKSCCKESMQIKCCARLCCIIFFMVIMQTIYCAACFVVILAD